MEGEPFHIDLKAVRRASKGKFWFKKHLSEDGREFWNMGCNGPNCVSGATPEAALAELITFLASMAHDDGGWN